MSNQLIADMDEAGNMPTTLSLTPQPQTISFSITDAESGIETVGVLSVKDGKWHFEGDSDAAAKCFWDNIAFYGNTYENELRQRDARIEQRDAQIQELEDQLAELRWQADYNETR